MLRGDGDDAGLATHNQTDTRVACLTLLRQLGESGECSPLLMGKCRTHSIPPCPLGCRDKGPFQEDEAEC